MVSHLERTEVIRLMFINFCFAAARASRRSLLIGVVVCALNQFSGMFALANYTATVFEEAGSNLDPNTSSIIVGITQLIGSYVSTILVERVGRKVGGRDFLENCRSLPQAPETTLPPA